MELKEHHTLHLDEAKEMQDSLKIETEGATASPKLGLVLTMYLQQALPTTKLLCGPVFYKHKVWTYNFNVHNFVSDRLRVHVHVG
jgi:hypothetical protein